MFNTTIVLSVNLQSNGSQKLISWVTLNPKLINFILKFECKKLINNLSIFWLEPKKIENNVGSSN